MSEDEKTEARLYFFTKCKIPGVVMCVDGTHIKIAKPAGDDTHLFYNRKGFFSLNTMIICDHKRRIRYVDATYPGGVTMILLFGGIAMLPNTLKRFIIIGIETRNYSLTLGIPSYLGLLLRSKTPGLILPKAALTKAYNRVMEKLV